LRIVLISYTGLAAYTISLANALVKHHRVLLIIAKKSAQPYANRIDESVEKLLIDFPRFRNPINLFFVIRLYFRLRRFNPHVLHFQGGFIWFTFILPWLTNWPIVTTIHDDVPHEGDKFSQKMKWFLPNTMALRYSDRLIVHGESIKANLLRQSQIPEHKIVSIIHGNGFLYKKTPLTKQLNNNRILFFGRILEYKGLPYLIKAQPLITKEIPDAKICIAGDGDSLKNYEHLISDKSFFEIYNHYIDSDLTATLFQQSSVVVLPYNEATQSGVVSVAYAFAKPVIATNVGCLPEIVEHNKTGLIIPPRDEKKLAEAIVLLLKNKKKRQQMSRNAYRKAINEMSWEKVATETTTVYLSILENRDLV